MRTLRLIFGLALVAAIAVPADNLQVFRRRLDALKEAKEKKYEGAIDQAVGELLTEVQKILLEPGPQVHRYLNTYRTTNQTGASGGTSGSTSVTALPLLADIFGISLEQGAVVRTVSGSTVTFQINPAGIICATKTGDATKARKDENCTEVWKRVSLALSFDQNRSNAPNGLTAIRDEFSEARLHIDLGKSREAVQRALSGRLHRANADEGLWPLVKDTQSYEKFKTKATEQLKSAQPSDVEQVWRDRLDEFRRDLATEDSLKNELVRKQIENFSRIWGDYLDSQIASEASKTSQFAFEAGFNRPDVAKQATADLVAGERPPRLFTARLIASRGFKNVTVVGNGSGSWFTERRPGMDKHIRDWQVSGSAIIRLREVLNLGSPSLAFGGMFGQLLQKPLGIDFTVTNPVSSAGVKLNQPGWIRLFQARLEVPTTNRNVVIPISFTYSNRTDLIKEQDVRASIGISIRFDELFPKPGNP